MNNPGFFRQLGIGFSSYMDALSFVINKRLWVYMLYPLVMSILIIWGGFIVADAIAVWVEDWIMQLTGTGPDDGVFGFMSGFLHLALTFFIKILLFLLFSSVSKFIVLILMSPVMAFLSEKTEEIMTGNRIPFDTKLFIKNFVRGIGIAIRNTFLQLGIVVLCMLICWIPVLGWISPVFLLLCSYYFYGFSMMDYVNERRNMNISGSVAFVRSRRTLAATNGFVFAMIFAIPFVGVLAAPVLAPVAACIAMLKLEKP
jgi:CysZ protein